MTHQIRYVGTAAGLRAYLQVLINTCLKLELPL
jgi:hypothetical protein